MDKLHRSDAVKGLLDKGRGRESVSSSREAGKQMEKNLENLAGPLNVRGQTSLVSCISPM
jgi:hypothetical protein